MLPHHHGSRHHCHHHLHTATTSTSPPSSPQPPSIGNDLSSAKAVLMANLLSCDPKVLSEVPFSDSYPNDMLNQDVQEMQYSEQTHVDDFEDNEIHSDTFNAFDKTLLDEITEVQTIFNQMETAVDQCSVDKNVFVIQIKQLRIDNDQLLNQIMSQEILHIVANSVDICDVKKSCVNDCKKCLELEIELFKKKDFVEKEAYDKLVKNLKAQLQEKVFAITALKNELRKIKGKNVVNIVVSKPNATLALGMFKLNIEPISAGLKNNRDAHETDSLKTKDSNNPLLTSTRVKPTTSASGSKPSGNTKNNRISRPTHSSQKNKVEDHPRTVKYSLNKTNSISEPIRSDATDVPSSSSLVNDRNDQVTKIVGYDDYQQGNVIISRVYYVEGLRHNLFYVGQFCDVDLEVVFRKNPCFIQNLKGVDLLSGSRDTNLYTISLDDMLKTSPVCLLSKASKTKIWLWHRRLSHLNFGTLNKLAKDGLARGLVPNIIPQQPCNPPKRDDWDTLFQPLFDEYFNPLTIDVSTIPVVAAPRADEIGDSSMSTSIGQDVPSSSIPSTQDQENSLIISQGVEESPKTQLFHDDPLHEFLYEDSTSQGSSSNVRPSHTPFEMIGRWNKDHPIANVIDDPSGSVSTRMQLKTDAMWCPNAANKNLMIFQMDVKMAFLNGELKKEIYISQPKGYVDQEYPSHVYKLKRSFTVSNMHHVHGNELLLYTIKKVQDTNSYEFLLANKNCTVNAEVFRTILDICSRVEGKDFTNVLDDETALTFLIDLGYKGPLNKHTNMFVDHMHQPWRTLAAIINKISKDYQEYDHPIPDVILTDAIKRSESYQMFIKYSTHQILPKKSKRKAKKKTASRRVVKKKATLLDDDNIISDDSDVALELAKSISQTKAEEAEAARKVHAAYARIVAESISESAKKKSSGRSSKSVVIQETPSATNSKSATLKTKLKGTSAKLGVLDKDKDITKENVILEWRDEQDSEHSDHDNEDAKKDEKDGDADDEGDDHVSDKQDDDDKDDKTESDEDDIYKYKIRVHKDEDEELKDAEVEGSDKGDEKITVAATEEAEKTSKAKDDTKKTKLHPSSSSLSISSGFGDQFLKLSSDSSLFGTVMNSADADVSSLLDIPIQHETPQIHNLDNKVEDVFQKGLQKHTAYLIHKYSMQHLPELTKKLTPTAEQESEKSPSEILKIKREQVESQKNPLFTLKSTDKAALKELSEDENAMDNGVTDTGKKTKRKRTKESESLKNPSSIKETSEGKAPTKGSKTGKSTLENESVEEPIAEVIMDNAGDELVHDDDQPQVASKAKTSKTLNPEWFKQSLRPPTPDPEWNKHQDVTYTTYITKTKAARYEIKGIEDMVPTLWSTIKHAYNKDASMGIKHWGERRKLCVKKLHGYGQLEDIVIKRSDQRLYKFKEGDFVDLHLNDIEDMLLLAVQHKLFHLDESDIVDFIVALYTGFKEPYTPSYDPPRIVYEDLDKQKRVLRADELYKFLDGTLKSFRDEIHHRVLNFRLDYNPKMPKRKWTTVDQKRPGLMIE
nr:integrase, catalytic region, zinc finger, CCHC-type, peptidase aspartic, catalytic [Tanacetum cinerariifolium]